MRKQFMLEIFQFWKKPHKEESEFVLEKNREQKGIPFLGVAAKAVLITMLVFGSLGGLLAAYDIAYNVPLCALLIFGLSLCYGAAYACKKKWVINLLLLGSLALYFVFAFYSFWYVNSGFYSVLNRIMEDARIYLGIYNGTEYQLVIDNEYLVVTYFVIFIGVIEALMYSIRLAKTTSMMWVILSSLPYYIIPMYFEKNLNVVCLLLLLAAYAMVAMMRSIRKGENPLGHFAYLLGVAVLFAAGVRLLIWAVPQQTYQMYAGRNELKRQSEKQISGLIQSGLMSFMGNSSSAGIGGGRLGNGSVSPDYETDLVVEYTPYSPAPVYLKSFIGAAYNGERWIPPAECGVEEDFLAWETLTALRENTNPARGKMVVTNVGVEEFYHYPFYPYYTDDAVSEKQEDGSEVYTYYPLLDDVRVDTSSVDEAYLEVPQRCLGAVADICEEAGLAGDEQAVADQIVKFFEDNYSYTLNPGYIWGGGDYITYFLKNSRRGYCMHFASAGTMLFRYMGIPARYVEGYVFSYNDVLVDGELVEDAEYTDYYSGYSGLGETGLVRLEIPDANAHAWVEIYVEGKGWVVVDPTPATTAEESESFWDVFRQRNRELENEGILGAGAQEYLEQVFDGAARILFIVAVVLALILAARIIYRRYRERGLAPRQRVQNLYRNLVYTRTRKHGELARARTIRQQLELLASYDKKKKGNARSWQELEQPLYRAFYGGGMTEEEYERLYCRLKRMR